MLTRKTPGVVHDGMAKGKDVPRCTCCAKRYYHQCEKVPVVRIQCAREVVVSALESGARIVHRHPVVPTESGRAARLVDRQGIALGIHPDKTVLVHRRPALVDVP